MRKNQILINRVEQYEYKKGITYIKSNGKLFVTLKVFLSIFFAWAITMNLLSILSWSLRIGTESFKGIINAFCTLSVCTALSILGFVLTFTRLKLIGNIVSIFTSVFTAITYAPLLEDATTRFGYKTIYFTRHFIPHAMIVLVSVAMLIIVLFEYLKFNSTYKKIEKNLYSEFVAEIEKGNSGITWEEYLNTVD